MDSYFCQKQQFEVKNILMIDLFHTNTQLLSSQDINWWTGVVWITCGLLWCFYQLFGLSFWRHPFTAEDPLLRQWCCDTFLQICWRNKLIFILDGLRVSNFKQMFIFGWTMTLTPKASQWAVLHIHTHFKRYAVIQPNEQMFPSQIQTWARLLRHSGGPQTCWQTSGLSNPEPPTEEFPQNPADEDEFTNITSSSVSQISSGK